MIRYFLLVLLIFVSPSVLSIQKLANSSFEGWVTKDGKPVPNSNAIKSINGFGGYLIVTKDPDWQEKWNTSPATTPYFSETNKVRYGERLTILTFFINPKLTADGLIEIYCDIKVTRPDGSISVEAKDIKCYVGKLHGNPRHIRLTDAIINYVGENSDPPGKWVVEVTLKDKLRNTEIPLNTFFYLEK